MSQRLPADTGAGGSAFLWVFSFIWLGIIAVAVAMDPASAPGVVCVAVPGLVTLALAVRTTRTRIRYVGAEFELATPVQVGGRIEGTLHLPQPAGEGDRIRATLICQRPRRRADPVLFRDSVFAGPAEPHEADRSRFPIRIDIPATVWPTGRERAYWRLTIRSEQGLPGLDIWFHVFVEGPSS
jgi:hypothetical protein